MLGKIDKQQASACHKQPIKHQIGIFSEGIWLIHRQRKQPTNGKWMRQRRRGCWSSSAACGSALRLSSQLKLAATPPPNCALAAAVWFCRRALRGWSLTCCQLYGSLSERHELAQSPGSIFSTVGTASTVVWVLHIIPHVHCTASVVPLKWHCPAIHHSVPSVHACNSAGRSITSTVAV